MVSASSLKSPVLLAIVIMGGLAVLASIIGLFTLGAIRGDGTADQLVVTFTGLLGIAFGGAGPVITHMIYSLSGVPQPGQGSDTTSTTTTITTGNGGQGATQ
jgi:hypothetical protein